MGLFNAGIFSLFSGPVGMVEVSADRLARLERAAGYGHLLLFLVISVAVFAIVHMVIKIKAEIEVKKIIETTLRETMEEVADEVIGRECCYGVITEEVKKQINRSCRHGEIFNLVKHGIVPGRYTPNDNMDGDDI